MYILFYSKNRRKSDLMKKKTSVSKKLLSLASGGPLALLVHARPDGDCVGSAVALAHLLGLLGCPSAIVSSDPLPARLSFLIPEGGGVVFSDGQTDGIFGPESVKAFQKYLNKK